MRRILLGRDGVINRNTEEFIKTPSEWTPVPGSLQAIARATEKGFRIIIVSNQSGLARGLFDIDQLNRIHALMLREIARVGGRIDAIFFCPHGPDDDCQCRKPRTGLLDAIRTRLNVELNEAVFIGDSLSDMQAAVAVKARPILVESGHKSVSRREIAPGVEVTVCGSLAAAIDTVLDWAA